MFLICLFLFFFSFRPVCATEPLWHQPEYKPSLRFYQKLTPEENGKSPQIAVVIDDMGVKKNISRRLMTLPAPLTFSFLPFATELENQMETARKSGHEIMIHMPMEPLKPIKEKMMLKTDMSEKQIVFLTEEILNSATDYAGVNNHMGSRFTANETLMRPVLKKIKQRDLFFLDSVTSKNSVGAFLAKKQKIPYAVRDVFIDNELNDEYLKNQLALLEEKALEKGYAIGIAHPHDATMDALSEWIPQAKERGFVFVRVSDVVTTD